MADVDSDKENPAARGADDIFHGKLAPAEAIERLRLRLLDLSARNRLLSYRHPRNRCVQFADKPDLDLLFERLTEGKSINISYIKEPLPLEYQGSKRPDARLYAQKLGIHIAYEFPPSSQLSRSGTRRVRALQALHYPADLEKLLRRIANEARTVVEETGTNMLYLMFGFLQFYEDDSSQRPLLAPVLSLPVVLSRAEIDENSRTYQYWLEYSGEDLAENQTLREKLRQDHSIQIPSFGEEETPEDYFKRLEVAVRTRPRWKVLRQLTLGFLAFGKLAIWADLDPKRWPELFENPILKQIFQGSTDAEGPTAFDSEDYDIDRHKWGNLPLIYDADASQHSAIIDAINGKNLVINGPPGTGKSQTITNIIATALTQGKKVLFVSEKLAALEVVRDRLEKAKLGCFCLELHSHKTQKKKLIHDLQGRLNQQFSSSGVQQQLTLLDRQKATLNRQAELMESRLGNQLAKTVHEIFWAVERWRRELGDLASRLASLSFADAQSWDHAEFEDHRAKVAELGRTYSEVETLGATRAWIGFEPRLLSPGEQAEVAAILSEAREGAEAAAAHVRAFTQTVGELESAPVQQLEKVLDVLSNVPQLPRRLRGELLPSFFPAGDRAGVASAAAIATFCEKIGQARQFLAKAAELINLTHAISDKKLQELTEAAGNLAAPALNLKLTELNSKARDIREAAPIFEGALATVNARFTHVTQGSLEAFRKNFYPLESLKIGHTTIHEIQASLTETRNECQKLSAALEKVSNIASNRRLPFDGTLESVAEFANGENIVGLVPGLSVYPGLVSDATALAQGAFAHFPIGELRPKAHALRQLARKVKMALDDVHHTAKAIGMRVDESVSGLAVFGTIIRIAQTAPQPLLKYRNESYESQDLTEVIAKMASAKELEQRMRVNLEEEFHLDALPSVESLKFSLLALRRSGLISFLSADRRAARRMYRSLRINRRKRKIRKAAEALTSLIAWIEHRLEVDNSPEYQNAFGPLFEGVNTDLERIQRIADWYRECRGRLLEHAGLVTTINLTSLDAEQLAQLSAHASTLLEEVELLRTARDQAGKILGGVPLAEAANGTLPAFLTYLTSLADQVDEQSDFFSRVAKPNLSCKRALELLQAKLEIRDAGPELHNLLRGERDLANASAKGLGFVHEEPFENWYVYLQKIRFRCEQVRALIELIGSDFSPTATPEQIEGFLVAAVELDRCLAELAPASWKRGIENWQSYLKAVYEISSAADRITSGLTGDQTADAPLRELLEALRIRVVGEGVVEQALADQKAQRLFGSALTGVDTDLAALSDTHAWGAQLVAIAGHMPLGLLDRLLSADGSRVLTFALAELTGMKVALRDVRRVLRKLEAYGKIDWNLWQAPVRSRRGEDLATEICVRLEIAQQSVSVLIPWSRFLSNRSDCRKQGMASLAVALEKLLVPPPSLDAAFNYVTYNSIARNICKGYSELTHFSSDAHELLRQQYIELDKRLIELNGARLASAIHGNTAVPRGTTGPKAGDFSEGALLRRELNKQRHHLPIRQLVRRAGRALQALKPCFMMGPLSVAQYLEPGSVKFDLVVMDEASQLRPEDALGAVARGSQLIVVGDPKQLPPTSFFDRLMDGADDEEPEDSPAVTDGMESILDICQQLFYPARALRWHYRSAHESLIKFSNHYFYDDQLIVFPSRYQRAANLGVKYRYIKNGFYQDRSNSQEARVVVDTIVEHMVTHPDESLGVVTVNQTQRDLILEMFERKLSSVEACREFVEKHETAGWPFFVKNLENVQGDERDVIFISCNFGKAPGTDKVRQNFGPIGRRDGWRRLNVLFTRARLRIDLFTSMQASDIIVDEKTPRGTRALRDYLEYSQRGFIVEADDGDRAPDSDFEIAVAGVLRSHGFEVKPQLGVAGYFIDIAVRHPLRRGEFIAAIECDGATYHSSRSARDRDRIRQEILERLGWKDRIYRIWSTDWFSDPIRATAKLLAFVESRLAVSESSAAEAEEEIPSGPAQAEVTESHREDALTSTPAEFDSSESSDLFIEVGDAVTYAPVESPSLRTTVTITAGASLPSRGLVNEDAPLAKALLGLYAGEIAEFDVRGQATRMLKIVKIRRDSSDYTGSATGLGDATH